ncbi:MAG: hypothetical protein ACOC56_02665 [Atribacterota bacterium]
MAKKTQEEFTFEDINKELGNISLYGSRMDKSTFSEVDSFISTGSYVLNLCLTGSVFGGIPNNRSVSLAGPSGCLEKDEIISVYKMKTMHSNRKILDINEQESASTKII